MKFWSDKTKQFYENIKDCEKAEKEWDLKNLEKERAKEKEAAERKAAAHDVEEKQKTYEEARKAYYKSLNDFCKKYGAFHQTVKAEDFDFDMLDLFNKFNYFNW